jgi:hypothetical protein
LPVCLGFETRQSLASNRVDPTQNPSGNIWQWGDVAFTPKKSALCLSFFAALLKDILHEGDLGMTMCGFESTSIAYFTKLSTSCIHTKLDAM